MSRPKVVILGAGPAGLMLAKSLVGAPVDVTIVEQKGYYEIALASSRALVDPSQQERIAWDYKDIPHIDKYGQWVSASVTSVDSKSVTLSNGSMVPYDYLAIATGSSYKDPIFKGTAGTLADRKAAYKENSEKLRDASSVLVVGGGPVAVEMAAEVVAAYPGKRVVVVSSGYALCDSRKPKFSQHCLAFLQNRGAKVILGDRVKQMDDGSYRTQKFNELLEADLVLWCIGLHFHTEFLAQNFAAALDPNGQIKVNAHLQVEGQPNMFALGDASNVKENKLAYLAALQGEFVAGQIRACVAAGGPAKARLKRWAPNNGTEVMMVALGRRKGAAQFGSKVVVWGWLMRKLKSSHMHITKFRHDFGLKG